MESPQEIKWFSVVGDSSPGLLVLLERTLCHVFQETVATLAFAFCSEGENRGSELSKSKFDASYLH